MTCGDKEETYVGITAYSNFQIKTRKPQSNIENRTETKFDGTKQADLESKGKQIKLCNQMKNLCRAPRYSNVTKRCNVCIAEQFHILCKPGNATLNKRNELISKCRHEDKFLLRYVI